MRPIPSRRITPGTARLELTPAQCRLVRRALTVYGELDLPADERSVLDRCVAKADRAAERAGS